MRDKRSGEAGDPAPPISVVQRVRRPGAAPKSVRGIAGLHTCQVGGDLSDAASVIVARPW